jgi:hypothetical protein
MHSFSVYRTRLRYDGTHVSHCRVYAFRPYAARMKWCRCSVGNFAATGHPDMHLRVEADLTTGSTLLSFHLHDVRAFPAMPSRATQVRRSLPADEWKMENPVARYAPRSAPRVVAISRNIPMRTLEKPSRTQAAAVPEEVAITEIPWWRVYVRAHLRSGATA